jgi:4-hydroxybenzoyl-CoA thioesterase
MIPDLLATAISRDGDHEYFVTRHLVRFGDVDPAGIAYFPRIHNYLHEAFENLWEEYIGVRYYHLIQHQRVAFPMVRSEVDFLHPLRFGDRPIVRVTCFHLGRSSLGLRYLYEVGGRLCVDARMTTVCVDTGTLASQPIPDAYRARFERIFAPLPAGES